MEQQVTFLEYLQDDHIDSAVTLQLHMEDLEDRSRQNNLWLWGLPEAMGPEDLAAFALEIFRRLSDDPLPAYLELNRIHRALGPCPAYPNHPWDVVCMVHHFTHKASSKKRGRLETSTSMGQW